MTIVAKILQSTPDATVHTITPAASVLDALRLMADKSIGALVVTEGEAIVGIFTERDYARKIALMGRTSAVTQVKDVMTSAVMFVKPDQTSEQCMQIMSNNRLRHLPWRPPPCPIRRLPHRFLPPAQHGPCCWRWWRALR